MKRMDADVDIDFADREEILKHIKHIAARQDTNVDSKKHNSGIYVTNIPYDPVHDCASINYKEAENRGYFKIDFLNVSVYKEIRDQQHYDELMNKEPEWERLLDKEFCSKVVHLSNHYDSIKIMKPDNIPRMAMFLALIRPGKKHLIGKSWKEIGKQIWTPPSDGSYYFKKSHSLSYAMLVKLHINILTSQHLESK